MIAVLDDTLVVFVMGEELVLTLQKGLMVASA